MCFKNIKLNDNRSFSLLSMNKVNFKLTLFLFLFLTFESLSAQMFSVKSQKKDALTDESSLIFSAGTSFIDFSEKGKTPSDYGLQTAQFNFNDPVYYLHGQFGLVHIHVDYGTSLGSEEQLRYTSLSLTFLGNVTLTRTKKFIIAIPLHLTTDSFTISSSDVNLTESRFEQTGFTFGTGIESSFQFQPWLRLHLSQLAHYGFSARGIGGNYGSKTLLESKIQLNTFRVWGNSRLSIHSSYLYHIYDIDSFLFDYNLKALTFGLGLSF